MPSYSYGGGGGGGGGGSGIIATTGANLINSSTITGGTGGGGGSSSGAINPFTDPSGNGTGGRGGNGITATGSAGLTITNTGTIKGGGGGTDFQNYQPYRPQAGGFGIIGQNLTIINSGTIAGGALGGGGGLNGAPSTAIIITGGTNSIKALAGSNIGAIELGGATTLAGTFNGTIQVDGGVTVSVTGSTAADDATGITAFNNFGTTSISAGRTLSAQTINNGAGMINIGAGATLRGTGNTLNNNTVINVGVNGSVIDAGAVNNQGGGTINFNGPTGTATLSSGISSIVNDGQIKVLGGAVAVTGDISNQNNGTLSLTGGDMTGIGTLTNSGTATVNVAAGYNLGVDTFTLTGGSVTGTGTITAATAFNLSNGTIGAAIAGAGVLTKTGAGTTVLTGVNTYSGGTNINGGTLSVSADANLGSGALSFDGGTLLATASFAASNDATLAAGGGTLSASAGNTLTYSGVLSGTGGLTKAGAGTVALAGANTYFGATTISNGTLQVGDGGTAGALADGDVANSGKLDFNRSDTVIVGNRISGSGALGHSGTGTTILTAASSDYTGATTVSAGKLIVNGSIASSSGVTVDAGAAIGGSGTIASTIVNGTLFAGNSPGTLTVAGNLTLNAGSTSLFELGTPGVAGGSTNDLVNVNGNLTLGGTLEAPSAVTGYYRLFNVSGTTTGSFDAVPTDAIVTTAAANQVNLLQRNGGQLLQFWDGTDVAGNGSVDGGTGQWSAGTSNWTGAPGEAGINDSWRGEVGVFAGTAGTVTVSGAIGFQGLQFSTDGYELSGGALDLSGDAHGNAGASFITTDAGVTATVSSVLASAGMFGLDKLGSGTLVLAGDNTYSGLTTISAGTLQLGNGGAAGSVAGDIVNQGVLTFNRSDSNLTLGGAISGTGRVEQNGTGTSILAGANTYTGGTTINAGTLQVGDGASTGSIAGNIVNNSALVFNRSDFYGSFTGDLSGSGTLTVTGGGTLSTSGDLSHTGGTTIDSGSVLVVGDGATHGSLAGNVANAGSLAFDRSDDIVFAGDISGSGTFHKYGAGVLALSGDNSAYDGIVNVQAGTLRVENSSAIGTGYLMMYSGALDYGANVDLANIMTLQQDNTELWVKQGSARQAGIILSGGGVPHAVEKKGAGVLIVDRMNHGGATTVSDGTLRAGGSGAFDSRSAVTVASGAKLDLGGFNQTIASLAGAGDVVLGAGRLSTGDAGSTAFSGGISGTGGLTKSGSGIFTLSGTNSYGGTTEVDAGTLKASAANSFASGSAFSMVPGARLDLGGYDQTIGSLTGAGSVVLGAGTLTLGGDGTSSTFAGDINGTGGLTKTGSGIFTLGKTGSGNLRLAKQSSGAFTQASSTYTGATKVDVGTLQAGAAGVFAPLSNFTVSSGAKLDLNGFDQTIGSLGGGGSVTLGAGTLTTGNASDTSFSGVISGGGGLVKQGTGTFAVTGTNTYTGTTSVKAGRLLVDGKLADTAVTIDSGATLGGSGTIDGAVAIADGGHLAPGSGPGPLTLGSLSLSAGAYLDYQLGLTGNRVDVNGDLTLDGTLNISAGNDFGAGIYRLFNYGGTLADNGLAIGTVPSTLSAGDLSVQTAVATQVNLVNTGGAALNFWDGGAPGNVNNGAVDGGDGVWSVAGGNWTGQDGAFNTPMTPQPGYAIFQGQAGTVTVDGGQGTIAVTGMQFATDGYRIEGDAIALGAPQTIIRVGDGTQSSATTKATIASELTGAGTLVKDDHGTLTLTGENTYTGGTLIKGGTLAISSNANLGAAAGGLAFDGGTLRNTAAMSTARDIDLRTAGGTFATDADLTASGMISGKGKLTKTGAATLTLTGASTYAQGTTISQGTLQLGNGGGQGSIVGDVANSGVLAFNRSDTLTFTGAISGSGSLKQIGTGKTVLTGANSYAGGTTIAAGTLAGSASSFGSGAILDDAALIIDQATDATFANAINGTGSFAKTGMGTLSLTGTSTYAQGTTISQGTLQLGNGSAQGSIVGDVANGGVLAFNRSDTLTFTGAISGSGSLKQIGTGKTVLTGANSYAGSTTIAAGTLAGSASSFGSGAILDDAALIIDQATDATFANAINGTGSFTKTGTGTLSLTGTSTYAQGTTISQGTLQLGNGGGQGSIVGDVANSGVLAFNRSDTLTFTGAISGSGSLKQIGTGKTVLTGANSYAGGTTIAAGTLAGSASSFGSGAILDDAALIIDQAVDATFANAINGTGSFTKTGTGRLNLTGTSLLSGQTTVNAGRLSVNGSLANSAVTLQSGASLGGTGTVGKVTALSGSTVAPGNSIGTLNVAGDASFAAGSIYQVEADATGKSDRLAVSGKVTLSGGTVQVLAATGDYATTPQYTILTAASGIAGQFASVTSNFAFLTPTLSYTANAISLSLARNDVSFGDVGRTRNQIAAAGGAEQLGTGNALYNAVTSLDEDTARKAFDALSGEVHASVNGMLVEDSRFLADAANARIRAAFGEAGATSVPVMAYGPGGPVLAEAATDRLAVWSQAYGSWGDTDSDGNAATFSRSTGGFVVGADTPIGDNWRLGVIGGYSQTSFDATDRASSGSSSSYHVGLFGGGRWGVFSLRGGAAYSWHDIETSRDVVFPGFSDSLAAKYHAGTAQVFGELGYGLNIGGVSLEPFGGLAHVNVKADGFSEQGGRAALASAGSTTETTFTTVGLRAGADFTVRDISATVRGMVGWRHAFGDTTPLSSLAFAGGGAFTVAGVPIAKDSAIVEAGLDFTLTPSATLGVSYTSQFGGAAIDQSFKANLGVKF
ncbi:autotransporter-associated beta strand repeat-containing protein [Mesorhizobium sp. AR07]|nr:autotransporter-associated beta strand repeat-containing protein [Mesorhizobium sp. AR07]